MKRYWRKKWFEKETEWNKSLGIVCYLVLRYIYVKPNHVNWSWTSEIRKKMRKDYALNTLTFYTKSTLFYDLELSQLFALFVGQESFQCPQNLRFLTPKIPVNLTEKDFIYSFVITLSSVKTKRSAIDFLATSLISSISFVG